MQRRRIRRARRSVITLLCASVIAVLQCAPCGAQDVLFKLRQPAAQAERARLPVFQTSDAAFDAFANEYLMRHLSIDEDGVYHGGGPVLGATDHLWVIDWDTWMLPWIDRGAMGMARQGGSDIDVILSTLANCTVDKYGYVFGAPLVPEPNDSLGGYKPTFGWPWPKYNRNTKPGPPTGWEFKGRGADTVRAFRCADLAVEPVPVDHRMMARITGDRPELQSPAFSVDPKQAPIVEVDVEYFSESGSDVRSAVDGLRLYWSTDEAPSFDERRCVGVEFSVLPPTRYRDEYARMAGVGRARYVLFFPMHLHPGWGVSGRRITGLKLAASGPGWSGTRVAVNFIRATYDVRMSTTNATLINAAAKFYLWSGDVAFLRRVMPKLRRSVLFLAHHLGMLRHGTPCTDWFVGHDGLGGDEPGEGLIGGYWDLLPCGRFDLDTSLACMQAMRSMAALERACVARGMRIPDVTVVGPDNRRVLRYDFTATQLDHMAARCRSEIEHRFWNAGTGRFGRNIDSRGRLVDYGYAHSNLQALAWDVGRPGQIRSVLSWLDGRAVGGDTSIGADIYRWRFAPRTSTRRNVEYYFWPWISDWRNEVESQYRLWGDQMQDGGAIPATSLWDHMARCATGDQDQIDRAWVLAGEIQRWFADVKAAGGRGRDFYRAYYDGHPERGTQQSPMPGGLGLDREFMSDAGLGAVSLLYAFLGVDAREEGVLRVAPAVPSSVSRMTVRNVFYRGNHLTIEAGHGYVSLEGSRLPHPEGLVLEIVWRGADANPEVRVDGATAPVQRVPAGRVAVRVPLTARRVEFARSGGR